MRSLLKDAKQCILLRKSATVKAANIGSECESIFYQRMLMQC